MDSIRQKLAEHNAWLDSLTPEARNEYLAKEIQAQRGEEAMTDITPTQEDRDAAIDFLDCLGFPNMASMVSGKATLKDAMGEKALTILARHRQAAIASVIAHATTPEAVKRATRAINVSGKLQDAITAALTEV